MGNYVTGEQIERAKNIKIEDYVLKHEPNNVKRVGKALYLKDHDSLEISNGLWNWHSRGIGGKNVVDFLIKVRGFGFVEAVRHLAGGEIQLERKVEPRARPPNQATCGVESKVEGLKDVESKYAETERAPFKLPQRNADNKRVIAYLEKRGIDRAIIDECINKNLLYESRTWHSCVFVGRDERGKAKFAALRDTTGNLKRDAEGSDKRYGFCLPADNPKSRSISVFESPIDAFSHKVAQPNFDGFRLSLGGTAFVALQHFLEHNPQVKKIIICTDNDTAGNLAAENIAEKAADMAGYSVVRSIPPDGFKDWNEFLQAGKNKMNEMNEVVKLEDKRKDVRFINTDYKTLFNVKDGDKIKFTRGSDGAESELKCRFIDEFHVKLIGKSNEDYHICELAEIVEKHGHKCEVIPDQKPKLDILATKYGEELKDVEIQMTDAAINKIVGGKYTTDELRCDYVLLRGKEGAAVLKSEGGHLTSVQPYWAETLKRELGVIEQSKDEQAKVKPRKDEQLKYGKARIDKPKTATPKVTKTNKASLLGELAEANAEAAVLNAAANSAEKSVERSKKKDAQEV